MGVRGDMEPRGSLYRTGNGESPVVYNAQLYEAPLLPFERQLIETIGATEEEYRYLVTEAVRRGKVRRSKLYYLRNLRGKSARITERKNNKPEKTVDSEKEG